MSVYRRGKFYWCEFEMNGRRIRETTHHTNQAAAKDYEAKRRLELRYRRAGLAPKSPPPKLEEYVRDFLAWSQQQHRPKTHELHTNNCDTLLRFFGGKWLDEITPAMVEDFKLARIGEARRNAKRDAGEASHVSPATVNRALTTLKLIFNHARRCGLAVENPTAGVAYLQENAGRMRVVSFEEEWTYMQAAGEPLRAIARVILDTGMRPEEVFRIEVANLDFNRRTIFNPHGKTKAAKRTVPMTAEVWQLLKQRAIAARGRYVFPSPNDPNKPIGSVRKAHDRAVGRASIQDHFRLYDLRHSYATRQVMASTDLPMLAALLGHTKIQMTMRYVHLSEEHKRGAVEKLELYKLAETGKLTERLQRSPQKSPQLVQ